MSPMTSEQQDRKDLFDLIIEVSGWGPGAKVQLNMEGVWRAIAAAYMQMGISKEELLGNVISVVEQWDSWRDAAGVTK